jgi:integrase
MDSFEYKKYNIERQLGRLRAWPEAIRYFETGFIRGLARGTIAKNLCDILSFLSFHNRPLRQIKEEDVRKWLLWTKSSYIKPSTFSRRVIAVKSFLKGINRQDLASVIPAIRYSYVSETMLITQQDIDAILSACKNKLETAFIYMLRDTGCRVEELLTLRKQNIIHDDLGIYIKVTGKTGIRAVRLMESVKWGRWLFDSISDYNGLVFKNHTYNWAYWIFRRASGKLNKPLHPHQFRHLKATEMLRIHTEAIVKKYLGWSEDSRMTKYYNHLSSRDVDESLLRNSSNNPSPSIKTAHHLNN